MKVEIPSNIAEFIKSLGDDVYVVGGFVRDNFCGFKRADIDIAGPHPAQMLNIPKGAQLTTVNHRMGTAQILYNDIKLEYTPFRVEIYDEGGEHTPSKVMFTTDIVADANRRDFTCNAIYYNVAKDEIVDPLGGVKDCEAKLIRGCNKKVFESDGLRLLRLVRFACTLGFKIEGETAAKAKENAALLNDITSERKRVELDKILYADTVNNVANAEYRGLRLIKQLGLWQYLIPELQECDGIAQPEAYHKYDVLEHSFQCVRFTPPIPNLRLAALLHDVGKAYTYKNFGNFHGHEKNSEATARIILNRLRYSNDVIDQVTRLCGLHMYDMDGKTKISRVRIFVAKNYDVIDKLVALIRADRLATGMVSAEEANKPHRFELVMQQMLSDGTPILKKSLKISGLDLVDMGFQKEAIASALEFLWRQCVINPALNDRDWLIKTANQLPKQL